RQRSGAESGLGAKLPIGGNTRARGLSDRTGTSYRFAHPGESHQIRRFNRDFERLSGWPAVPGIPMDVQWQQRGWRDQFVTDAQQSASDKFGGLRSLGVERLRFRQRQHNADSD